VFDAAREHGLVLLRSGRLIDTRRGEQVPDDDPPMPPTTAEDVALLTEFDSAAIAACTIARRDFTVATHGPFAHIEGVLEYPLVGGSNPSEPMPPGKLGWQHGFHVRAVHFASAASIPAHSRDEEEVLLMHKGQLRLRWPGGEIDLGPGDTLTVPKQLRRSYENMGSTPAEVYVVRGGDYPAPPHFA
jgi:mannose-6-phosphate isomerase-like protein (cupin superfamily)